MSPDQPRLRAYGRYSGLTAAEADVYRRVEEAGARPVDVARRTDRDPSTVRTLLQRAREKVDQDGDPA